MHVADTYTHSHAHAHLPNPKLTHSPKKAVFQFWTRLSSSVAPEAPKIAKAIGTKNTHMLETEHRDVHSFPNGKSLGKTFLTSSLHIFSIFKERGVNVCPLYLLCAVFYNVKSN